MESIATLLEERPVRWSLVCERLLASPSIDDAIAAYAKSGIPESDIGRAYNRARHVRRALVATLLQGVSARSLSEASQRYQSGSGNPADLLRQWHRSARERSEAARSARERSEAAALQSRPAQRNTAVRLHQPLDLQPPYGTVTIMRLVPANDGAYELVLSCAGDLQAAEAALQAMGTPVE